MRRDYCRPDTQTEGRRNYRIETFLWDVLQEGYVLVRIETAAGPKGPPLLFVSELSPL
jgi:hypothetical protein